MEEQLDASELLLGRGIRLHPALRLLYRFKNGQRIGGKHMQGLFGGCELWLYPYPQQLSWLSLLSACRNDVLFGFLPVLLTSAIVTNGGSNENRG